MSDEVQQEKSKSNNSKYIAIIGLIVIVIAVIGFSYENSRTQQKQTTASNKSLTALAKPQKSTILYKNGTYTAEGDYIVHVGPQHIMVTITLKNDRIVNSSVAAEAKFGISAHMQSVFIANYKQYVIGKDISTVHLGKISLSSLTPNGFNDALLKIENQAKV